MKIGFVTCAADKLPYYFPTLAEPDFIPLEPPLTPDDHIAATALRAAGHEVTAVVWNQPVQSLRDLDLIVVRSPWDYMDTDAAKAQFLQWIGELEQAGLRVANPVALMQWLLDKHYLQALSDHGVKVIPTRYLEVGATVDLLKTFEQQGAFVLKPCVSAGGIGLYHIASRAEAIQCQDVVNACLQTDSYMLQDFIEEITEAGEWSLIFLGGEYSHALHKMPGPDSIMVHAERGGALIFGVEPPASVVAFAKQAYAQVLPAFTAATGLSCDPKLVLYMRMDVIETRQGPVLIECEGVEPELFFRAKTGAENVFCEAVKQLVL